MKIGLLMVITAVSLFTGTVVWSTVTPVERKRYDITERVKNSLKPDRKTEHAFFYQIKNTASCRVNAPVKVELDESFTGVELLGDTSVLKYLLVHTNQMSPKSDWVNIEMMPAVQIAEADAATGKIKKNTIKYDSTHQQIVAAANITVRIGIGSGEKMGIPERQLVFLGCKKVQTVTPVTGRKLLVNLGNPDSTILQLNVQYLELNATGSSPKYVALRGKVDWAHYMLSFTDLYAQDLVTEESYLSRWNDSSANILATEIVNARRVKDCLLNIIGNPTYQRIAGE